MPSPVPNSTIQFPKVIVTDGEFVLFTPGNPATVVIEGGGGSGTLPTADAADATVGSPTNTTVLVVGAQDPSGNTQPLKVDVSGNLLTSGGGGGGSNPAAGPTGTAVPADASYTGINVAGNLVGVSTANPMPVSATALPLPTGASTSALQTTGNTSLASIDSKLTNPLPVSGTVAVSNFPATQPVSGTVTVVQPTGTNLHVDVDQPLPAGTNVIGHVIADTGSTTVVTGNVAVTNAGLTNLDVALSTRTKPADQQHTIIDSGTTVVTQPTGTNLHIVVDSGSITANAGTNLNTSALALDATLTGGTQKTRVTGNTGAAMDAAGQNAASPANELLVAGQFNTSPTTITTGNVSPLQLDSSGNLLVNIKAGSSGNGAASNTGAAVPAQASYTGFNSAGNLVGVSSAAPFPVTLANTGANATAVKVDGSAVTQPVSGTVTANIGTSGSLALDASVTGLQVAQGSTTSGQKGELNMGAVTTSNPSYSNGQTSPLSLDASGALRTSLTNSSTNLQVLPAIANAATQTWSEGTNVYESVDLHGSQRTAPGVSPISSVTWNNGTALNTALNFAVLNYPTVIVTTVGTGTVSGGGYVVEGSTDGGSNYVYAVAGISAVTSTPPPGAVGYGPVSNGGSNLANASAGASFINYYNTLGFTHVRVRLATVITGAGSINLGISGSAISALPSLISGNDTVGSVIVKQATGANLNVAVSALPTLSTVTTVSTVSASRTVGNAGATMDSTVGAATAPTNALATSTRYTSSAPALTANQAIMVQCDSAGTQFVRPYRRSQYKATPVTITASTSPVTAAAAQGANIFADITGFYVTVTTAATTATTFTITLSDGTANYVFDLDTGALATASADPTILNFSFPSPLPATTANTAWTATSSSATPTMHIVTTFINNLAN
jgi:hypothetical protein